MAIRCFAALRADGAATREVLDAHAATTTDIEVEGQLMHERRISRKCSFFDLRSVDALEQASDVRLEVILKIIDDELSLDEVQAIRHRVSLGDVVCIRGFLEQEHADHAQDTDAESQVPRSVLLHARDMQVVHAWKDMHPGVPFVPAPSSRASSSRSASAAAKATPAKRAHEATQEHPAKKQQQQHCKFWINTGTCQRGEACTFHHASESERSAARIEWLQERLLLKREYAKHEEDPWDAQGRISKHQRAEVFVEWLVTTFGKTLLSSGAGVVDVAGGRGNVSFELWNKRQIPCTLIDPRPIKVSSMQYKYFHQQKVPKASIPSALVPQKQAWFDDSAFLEDPANRSLIENASVLVGMHPDEATDAIFDVALRFDKPFAVMPCCVFSHKFPDRRLPDGESKVLSFEDYERFLLAKHASIRKTFLPFNGRNLVLYRSLDAGAEAEGESTVSSEA